MDQEWKLGRLVGVMVVCLLCLRLRLTWFRSRVAEATLRPNCGPWGWPIHPQGQWLHHIRLPKENQPKSHEKEYPKSNTHKLKINPENQQRTRLRINSKTHTHSAMNTHNLHLKSTQNSSNPIMAKPLIQQLKHQFNPSIISTKNHNPRYLSISFG
jgi:hypothetical protein